jgi:hypothetical protein
MAGNPFRKLEDSLRRISDDDAAQRHREQEADKRARIDLQLGPDGQVAGQVIIRPNNCSGLR